MEFLPHFYQHIAVNLVDSCSDTSSQLEQGDGRGGTNTQFFTNPKSILEHKYYMKCIK